MGVVNTIAYDMAILGPKILLQFRALGWYLLSQNFVHF
jgi:hypothetical protein